MTYKEHLEVYKNQENFYPYKLIIAVEINYFLEDVDKNAYNDDDFESMCELAYTYFSNCDCNVSTPTLIASTLCDILFEDNLFDVKEINENWCEIEEELSRRLKEVF